MQKIRQVILVSLILAVLMIGLTTAVKAAPGIQWYTEDVYYDNFGKLVIEGYFYNNGSRTINWIDSHQIKVYFRTQTRDWWLQAETTFTNLNVFIKPGETSRWTLRITNVDYDYYEYWLVDWKTDYRYL